ncbi:MAG: hypothetical protein NVSMB16_06780 [Acidimicrobiales bacterium]
MSLEALSEVIDGLVEAGPDTLGDAESMVELRRQFARLDAVIATATARFDTSHDWEADGARSPAAWLAWKTHIPAQVARRQVRLGRTLRHLPACESAWLAGNITADHVATIAAVRRPETKDALARDEAVLVGHASTLRFDLFTKSVDYWAQRADPNGAEDDDRHRRNRRDVHLDQSFHGMWFGKMLLDPVSGAIVAGELSRIEQTLFQADWADARLRLGREPTVAELARTPGQRRADALLEMATRSATVPPNGRRPTPLFSVLVGYETFHGPICELAGGTVIAPGALIPWLDQAYLERITFSPDNRVDVSETARLFTGATRRAIELRDRYCTQPTCDIPADRCQVDHIIPYAAGGPTTQTNGRLLCGPHNRNRPGATRPPTASGPPDGNPGNPGATGPPTATGAKSPPTETGPPDGEGPSDLRDAYRRAPQDAAIVQAAYRLASVTIPDW